MTDIDWKRLTKMVFEAQDEAARYREALERGEAEDRQRASEDRDERCSRCWTTGPTHASRCIYAALAEETERAVDHKHTDGVKHIHYGGDDPQHKHPWHTGETEPGLCFNGNPLDGHEHRAGACVSVAGGTP